MTPMTVRQRLRWLFGTGRGRLLLLGAATLLAVGAALLPPAWFSVLVPLVVVAAVWFGPPG
jgi:hypothetical protein